MPDVKFQLTKPLEIKAADDETGVIEGFGAMFDQEDSYGDVILKGAFADTLKSGRKVKMLFQHDTRRVIGVWDEMSETDEGLRVKGRISKEVQDGRDTLALIRMDALDGLSIGFNIPKGGADFDEKRDIRLIKKLDLWELSVVTFPAMQNARIDAVKSQEEIDALDLKGIERALREAGLSRDEAKNLLHRHAHLIAEREALRIDEALTASKAAADLRRALLG